MSAHVDTLDQKEPMAKWFAGSIILHVSAAGALLGYAAFESHFHLNMGSPNGGGFGAVAVNVTSQIPLAQRNAPMNPVANDTESSLPTPPPKAKAKPQPKAKPKEIPADAVRLPSKNAVRRNTPEPPPMNKFREKQTYAENQVYSNQGQALSSPMFSKPGAGGVGVGTASPFGQQYGWYADLLQRKVAGNWETSTVDGRFTTAPAVVVTFTIRKDGSLAPGSLKVKQSSGIISLDLSAQHAILNSVPFAQLPQGFPKNDADVELRFELRR
ncbi:MAG: TonB C-terminal domain-containing protein [Candidatus Sulfopaludibacter sp.]|nr:TonB C-terminal domain-containing protein [Candidatus Sulfopaludibacter sp.]